MKHFTDIKSYEDACKRLGIEVLYNVTVGIKIKIIAAALNSFDTNVTGKFPDWGNTSQHKYYPYFLYSCGVSRFYGSSHFFADRFSVMVSYLKSRELSDYMGNHFISLYKEFQEEDIIALLPTISLTREDIMKQLIL